jgi:DNA-binding response OmpR family regulator
MVERVLLVENDELLGVLFELALCEAGYAVVRARNGAEAMAALSATPTIGLLVTDVGLGDGPDGWQVARRARARSPDMPVIYMTGGRADEWLPQHVPLGVLLLKPFPIDQLVEMVGHLVSTQSSVGGRQKTA